MQKPLKILYVDDYTLDRALVRDALVKEHRGFRLTEAASREEFEARLAEGGYDLVLTDFNILGFEGLQVIDAIQAQNPGLPVIMVTGTGSEQIAVEAMKRGAADYVIKSPGQIRRLPHIIYGVIEKRRAAQERQQAEEFLKQSEARYRSLFENTQDAILIANDAARYVDVNPAACRMFGYSRQEFLEMHLWDITPTANVEQGRAQWRAFLEAGEMGGEYTVLRKDGTEMAADFRAVANILPGRHLSVLRDISERVKAERELRRNLEERLTAEKALGESQRTLSTLMSNLPGMAYRCLDDANWTMEFVSEGCFELTGYHPTELIENREVPFVRLIHEEDRAHVRQQIQAAAHAGEPFELTYRIVTAAGEVKWIWERGRAVSDPADEPRTLEGLLSDVTEKRRAEEERDLLLARVQEQSALLQQIMNTVPEGVILLAEDNEIVLANPEGHALLEVLADSRPGDTLTHLGNRPLAELLTSPPKGLWHSVTTHDQNFELIARPLETGPHHNGWVLVARDVTQEQEIQHRSQRQERLAAVGQLAAGIAHDFNNIMAVIVLYTQMTLKWPDLPPKIKERLETVSQQADRATDLIQQILDFSRRSVLERQPLNLVPFVKEQIKLLERTLPESIKITLSYGTGDHTIHADPTRVQQAVMNLAFNARDAMPEGGELKVRLECIRVTDPKRAPLPEMKKGEWVRLIVADTGTGIPSDVLPHIFEPFFTTKAPGQGSGLGLPQVWGIVAQHHGHVDVTTKVGEGTTFVLYFPLLPTAGTVALNPEAMNLSMGQGETLLVVEDDKVTRQALIDSLEMLDYRVLAATNGQEALAILERRADEIDLVLSDVVMPDMGGIALFHALRESRPSVPVVLMTGHSMEDKLEGLRDHGLSHWLLKPPKLENLSHILAQALENGAPRDTEMET